MRRLLRLAVLALIALLVVAVVVGIGRPETGPLEKLVLALGAALLVLAATQVRRRLA